MIYALRFQVNLLLGLDPPKSAQISIGQNSQAAPWMLSLENLLPQLQKFDTESPEFLLIEIMRKKLWTAMMTSISIDIEKKQNLPNN